MFTLLMDLGKYAGKAIKAGLKAYKACDGDITQARLATVALAEVKDWKPRHKGTPILTPGLRVAFAGALAGLAYNIGAAEAGRPLL